jgi:hypothetical protein
MSGVMKSCVDIVLSSSMSEVEALAESEVEEEVVEEQVEAELSVELVVVQEKLEVEDPEEEAALTSLLRRQINGMRRGQRATAADSGSDEGCIMRC